MSDFSIQIQDRALREALRRLASRLQDATPAMEGIARALRNHAEDAFERETSPFGDPWEDLQDTTKQRRERRGHWPGQILQVTGGSGLAGSISSAAGADWAQVGAGKIGAAKEYAAIHQFGGTPGMPPGPAGVPARLYLPVDQDGNLPDNLRREILDILAGFLGS